MDPYDEEATTKYMMDAINEDTRVNAAEQFGAEVTRIADSFLNMSGNGSDEDDDFNPTPAQQPVLVRILIMRRSRALYVPVSWHLLIYLLLHLVML